MDNSVFSAEYGHVSGAVVNIVTRSGSDSFRGEAFEFFRNDALDARNFFEFTSTDPHPFERNQFGGSVGGPIRRGRTFFFAAYEGVRQRQGVDLNSLVLSDEQRAAATDPAIRQLIPLIPRANYFDAERDAAIRRFGAGRRRDRIGGPLISGTTPAPGIASRCSTAASTSDSVEPAAAGQQHPGIRQRSQPFRSILTIGETHMFGTATVNEVRFGRSRLVGGTFPAAPLNPTDFGIGNGVTRPIGLPQMIVAGDLNFGGPGHAPAGPN